MTTEDVVHAINSFVAVGKPVLITMVLAFIAVCNIIDPASVQVATDALVYSEDDIDSSDVGSKLGKSFVNATVRLPANEKAKPTLLLYARDWCSFCCLCVGFLVE